MAQTTATQIKVLSDYVAEGAATIGYVGTGNTERLELLAKMREDIAAIERLTVKECRNCDWTWQEIGDAFGTTKQNVQQRFG